MDKYSYIDIIDEIQLILAIKEPFKTQLETTILNQLNNPSIATLENSDVYRGVAKIQSNVNKAWNFILSHLSVLSNSEIEKVLYSFIVSSYWCERNLEDPTIDIIQINNIKDKVDHNMYKYLTTMYNHMQLWFKAYLEEYIYKFKTNISEREWFWTDMKMHRIADCAKDLLAINAEGEIANRLAFIIEFNNNIIYNHIKSIESDFGGYLTGIDYDNIDYTAFFKYVNLRRNFLQECYKPYISNPEITDELVPYVVDIDKTSNEVDKLFNEHFFTPCDSIIYHKGDDCPNWLDALVAKEKYTIKANKEKADLLQTFSHRYKNMQANTLYNIAQTLCESNDKELQKHGATLLVEYEIKQNLSSEVSMLEMMFSYKYKEVKEKICKSIKTDSSNMSIIISEIIKKHLISAYFDDKDILSYGFNMIDDSDIPDSYGRFWDSEKSFKRDVLFNNNINCTEWFSNNITHVNFNIDKSSQWNNISFDKNGFAELLIKDIISELIKNMFKYADKNKYLYINLYDEDDCLIVETKNSIYKEIDDLIRKASKKHGLKDKILSKLNSYVGMNKETITTDSDGIIFITKVRFSKELFMAIVP